MLYKNTAVKAKNSKRNAYFAFGRDKNGYKVYVIKDEYVGWGGDLRRKWYLVDSNLSVCDAVALLNKRVGFKAYDVKSFA